MRTNLIAVMAVAMCVNVGMWFERFVIIVISLHRDYLPSAWGYFIPTVWDWAFLAGSLCTFAWLFLAFIRLLPALSMSEMRELVHERQEARP